MEQLAAYLKKARKDKGLTLRAVQQETGVSNPYLSQLENGKIRKPSPSVLHKLADCYGVSYELLLQLGGHPTPKRQNPPQPFHRIGTRLEDLTEEEEEKLTEYLEFLRTRKQK
jgi:transcriptional regulator with XRE-family HTH domain